MARFDDYCSSIQKQCLPGIWSKGVALSRSGALIEDRYSHEEIIYRVTLSDRPVSPQVSLWPEDEDWFCTCGDRNEICAHVAAAALTLKNRSTSAPAEAPAPAARAVTQVHSCFFRRNGALHFERQISHGETREPLRDTLISVSGGISSGRLPWPPLAATQEDFAIDSIRPEAPWTTLFKALASSARVELDGKPIQVSPQPIRSVLKLTADGNGYRLKLIQNEAVDEVFSNGAALSGDRLWAIEPTPFSETEIKQLTGSGTFYPPSELTRLATEVVPRLESLLRVEIAAPGFPRAERIPPSIQIEVLPFGSDGEVGVIPRLTYGSRFALRDAEAERALAKRLHSEFHLALEQMTRFSGLEAVRVVAKLRESDWAVTGTGLSNASVSGTLMPRLETFEDGSFHFEFSLQTGNAQADAAQVLRAWRENASLVPLLGGGWAKLPEDWLNRYGQSVERLLAARDSSPSRKKLPRQYLPELAALATQLGATMPASLTRLKALLEDFDGIPVAELPPDLSADLRPYQKAGVNWLCFLRDAGLGALLADDMGLGKTLQALCAVRGPTLIVAPTSVLHGWAQQIEAFRPSLSYQIYHGSNRRLSESTDVILTTYGLLRQDRELLTAKKWGTAILDESQTIKNPDSQAAQAAHSIQAEFRIALTGTPIENKLDDLWSQFEFVAPGFLGAREELQGLTPESATRLKKRVKPFILRRLKRDVAPELPPRTETVLEAELNAAERDFYQSLLAATRATVLEKLESGEKGGVFAALEALLRLRQACCHAGLVPGSPEDLANTPSSKLELLLQSLDQSIGGGHRSLVFSQWTSFLDRIEAELDRRGIGHLRLDGATSNRGDIVDRFQDPNGPPVLLISLKAGGVGLTLTAADHIYLMDPWWNPAVEEQAADRAHRIGQKNPVLIHRLIASDSIEERILLLQKTKTDLARSVLSPEEDVRSGTSHLSRDDLLELLR